MTKKIGVIIMSLLLVLYVVAVTNLAIAMLRSGDGVVITMGVALVILPLFAVWGLYNEIAFGVRSERLLAQLESEGGLPSDTLPARASGRLERGAADAAFPKFKAEVEGDPDSWRAWLRLALAYDASGDRRRARGAVRQAISLSRSSR